MSMRDNKVINIVTVIIDNNISYFISGYIPVTPDTNIYVTGVLFSVAYYDVDKNFVSSPNSEITGLITTPSNVAYLRFSAIKNIKNCWKIRK